MPKRIFTRDWWVRHLAAAYFGGLFIALVGVGTVILDNRERSQEAQELAGQVEQQSDRIEALTQNLCETFSGARTASNDAIRTPLRTSLSIHATVLMAASKSPSNRGTPRERLYRELAGVALAMSKRPVDVGPVPCLFETPKPKPRDVQ